MAPPPITPSPHRFITNKPTNPTPKPPSSLRFQHQQAPPSSSQFAPTPRFSFSSSQRPVWEASTPATQYSSPLSRRPHLPSPIPGKHKEDIEETDSNREDAHLNEEETSRFAVSRHPTSKRRRPNSTQESITISSSPSPSPPATPPLPTTEHEDNPIQPQMTHHTSPSHTVPRFVLPSATAPTIPTRPPLILPTRSPSPPSSPPPAFFSPHRRGQKYIPNGLASTTRDWIIETAQVAYGRKEGWDILFRVGNVSVSGGLVFVTQGMEGNDGGWVLVGNGKAEGEVRVGSLIGVRRPFWEVEVERVMWKVGVEWRVLDG